MYQGDAERHIGIALCYFRHPPRRIRIRTNILQQTSPFISHKMRKAVYFGQTLLNFKIWHFELFYGFVCSLSR